jgi:hypothetical protein
LRAVVNAESTGRPVFFTEGEEQGPVSAAKIEECRVLVRENGRVWIGGIK